MKVHVLILSLVFAATATAGAQPTRVSAADTLRGSESIDIRLLRVVYESDGPVMAVAMRGADATAYPVSFGAAPVVLGIAVLQGSDTRPAIRLGLSGGLAAATTLALKHAVGRDRPFVSVPRIANRGQSDLISDHVDPNSFPSGHTTMAFALATSASLSEPRWYVIAPAMTWATAVAASRMWLGVHYPSDVLAGAAIGAGSATLIHLLLPNNETASGFQVAGTIRF
jgi:membrane-associated phospholipid phosphatase